MSKAILLLTAFLAFTALCTAASAAGKRPADAWIYYHFDGSSFVAGPADEGSPFVAIQEKMRPVFLSTQTAHIDQTPLPDGTGVIAGICYIQSSGGKLTTASSFVPYPRVPLLIATGGKEFVTVLTNDHGYFMAVLPAGIYSVGSGPFTAEITVERGITTLVPLRAGKRMVD